MPLEAVQKEETNHLAVTCKIDSSHILGNDPSLLPSPLPSSTPTSTPKSSSSSSGINVTDYGYRGDSTVVAKAGQKLSGAIDFKVTSKDVDVVIEGVVLEVIGRVNISCMDVGSSSGSSTNGSGSYDNDYNEVGDGDGRGSFGSSRLSSASISTTNTYSNTPFNDNDGGKRGDYESFKASAAVKKKAIYLALPKRSMLNYEKMKRIAVPFNLDLGEEFIASMNSKSASEAEAEPSNHADAGSNYDYGLEKANSKFQNALVSSSHVQSSVLNVNDIKSKAVSFNVTYSITVRVKVKLIPTPTKTTQQEQDSPSPSHSPSPPLTLTLTLKPTYNNNPIVRFRVLRDKVYISDTPGLHDQTVDRKGFLGYFNKGDLVSVDRKEFYEYPVSVADATDSSDNRNGSNGSNSSNCSNSNVKEEKKGFWCVHICSSTTYPPVKTGWIYGKSSVIEPEVFIGDVVSFNVPIVMVNDCHPVIGIGNGSGSSGSDVNEKASESKSTTQITNTDNASTQSCDCFSFLRRNHLRSGKQSVSLTLKLKCKKIYKTVYTEENIYGTSTVTQNRKIVVSVRVDNDTVRDVSAVTLRLVRVVDINVSPTATVTVGGGKPGSMKKASSKSKVTFQSSNSTSISSSTKSVLHSLSSLQQQQQQSDGNGNGNRIGNILKSSLISVIYKKRWGPIQKASTLNLTDIGLVYRFPEEECGDVDIASTSTANDGSSGSNGSSGKGSSSDGKSKVNVKVEYYWILSVDDDDYDFERGGGGQCGTSLPEVYVKAEVLNGCRPTTGVGGESGGRSDYGNVSVNESDIILREEEGESNSYENGQQVLLGGGGGGTGTGTVTVMGRDNGQSQGISTSLRSPFSAREREEYKRM